MASQSHSPHTILEIGCGSYPFPMAYKGRRPLSEEQYVGIDRFPGKTEAAIASLQAAMLSSAVGEMGVRGLPYTSLGRMALIRASGTHLPFKDNSIREVVAVDFFGDRSTYPEHEKIASEVARVLHRSGRLAVVETRSPRPLDDLESADDFPGLRTLMARVGLVQTNRGTQQHTADITPYAYPSSRHRYGMPDAGDYIAVFKHVVMPWQAGKGSDH